MQAQRLGVELGAEKRALTWRGFDMTSRIRRLSKVDSTATTIRKM